MDFAPDSVGQINQSSIGMRYAWLRNEKQGWRRNEGWILLGDNSPWVSCASAQLRKQVLHSRFAQQTFLEGRGCIPLHSKGQIDLQSWKTVIASPPGAKGTYACFLIIGEDPSALSSGFLFWNGIYCMWWVHLAFFLSPCQRTSTNAKMLIFWHSLLVINVLCLWHKTLTFSISKSTKMWQVNSLACK